MKGALLLAMLVGCTEGPPPTATVPAPRASSNCGEDAVALERIEAAIDKQIELNSQSLSPLFARRDEIMKRLTARKGQP